MEIKEEVYQSKLNEPYFLILESKLNYSESQWIEIIKEEMIYRGLNNERLALEVGMESHILKCILAQNGTYKFFSEWELNKICKKLGI